MKKKRFEIRYDSVGKYFYDTKEKLPMTKDMVLLKILNMLDEKNE